MPIFVQILYYLISFIMKVSKLFAAIVFTGSVCVALAACGSDEETPEKPGEGPSVEKPTQAYIYYQIAVTKDLKSAVDLKAVYTQANGLNDTVAVNDTAWSKMIKVEIPFTGKAKALFSKKEGFEPTKDAYLCGVGGTTFYNYLGGNLFIKDPITARVTIPGFNMDKYITERILTRTYEWSIELKK